MRNRDLLSQFKRAILRSQDQGYTFLVAFSGVSKHLQLKYE